MREEVRGRTDKGVIVIRCAGFQEGDLGLRRCADETACKDTTCCTA